MLSKEQIDHFNKNPEMVSSADVRDLITMLQEAQKDLEDANAIKAMIMDERSQWENAAQSIVEALGEPVVGLQSPSAVEKIGLAQIQDARKDVARIDWLESRKKLELYSDNSVWTREDGTKFVNSHRLAEGHHMHGTGVCLRDIIDNAMQQSSTQNKGENE